MALSDNLQGWWCPSLDTAGNGTTTLTDLSGNGNNGTLTNMDAATDWVADTASGGVRALDFAAGSEYVRINNAETGTNLATSLSIWVYFRSVSLNSVAIWSQLRGVNEGWYVTFDAASGNKFLFTDGVNVANNIGISGAEVPALNQWSHIAFCVDASKNWVYYLNGFAVKSGTFGADIVRNISTIYLGRRTNTVNALIDGTALYNRQLTSSEVAQIYNGGRSLNLLASGGTGNLAHVLRSIQQQHESVVVL